MSTVALSRSLTIFRLTENPCGEKWSGNETNSGHVINLPQDVACFANSLPHLPSELDIVVILGTFSFRA